MQLTNEWIERGKVEVRLEGRRDLILRQLRHQIGLVTSEMEEQIAGLPDVRLDELAEALLDFQKPTDAEHWLASRG